MAGSEVEEQLAALNEKVESGFTQTLEAIGSAHSAIAETRRDIGALDDKLVRVQEAIYFLAHKKLHDREAEELRSMLPDPPKRRHSFQ